jgi:hypothetical protein
MNGEPVLPIEEEFNQQESPLAASNSNSTKTNELHGKR